MRVKPIGVPDCFVEHGSIKEQRNEVGLTPERVVKEVHSMLFATGGNNRLTRA